MAHYGNNITRDMEFDFNKRTFAGIELKKITDKSNAEEINEDLTKIIDKLNQIDFRFQVIERAIINAANNLEDNTNKNKKAIEELKNELSRLKRLR